MRSPLTIQPGANLARCIFSRAVSAACLAAAVPVSCAEANCLGASGTRLTLPGWPPIVSACSRIVASVNRSCLGALSGGLAQHSASWTAVRSAIAISASSSSSISIATSNARVCAVTAASRAACVAASSAALPVPSVKLPSHTSTAQRTGSTTPSTSSYVSTLCSTSLTNLAVASESCLSASATQRAVRLASGAWPRQVASAWSRSRAAVDSSSRRAAPASSSAAAAAAAVSRLACRSAICAKRLLIFGSTLMVTLETYSMFKTSSRWGGKTRTRAFFFRYISFRYISFP